MAISYQNAAGPFTNNPVTSQTTAFDVGSGTDRFLYVWVLGDAAATTGISGITYAGVSMTKLATHRVGTDRSFDVYYLVNPTSGSNNVVISRGVSGVIVSGFVAYNGVHQTTPIPSNTTFTDTTADTTVAENFTTTINNSWAIIGMRDDTGRTITPGSGYTSRVTNVGSGVHLGDSGAAISPAGVHTFNATFNLNCSHGAIMFELAESASAPAASNQYFTMMGVG